MHHYYNHYHYWIPFTEFLFKCRRTKRVQILSDAIRSIWLNIHIITRSVKVKPYFFLSHAVRFIAWSPISSMTPPPLPPPTVFFGIQPNTCDSMLNNLNNIQLFRAAHLLRIAPRIVFHRRKKWHSRQQMGSWNFLQLSFIPFTLNGALNLPKKSIHMWIFTFLIFLKGNSLPTIQRQEFSTIIILII